MKSQAMIQRWFSFILLSLILSSCTPPQGEFTEVEPEASEVNKSIESETTTASEAPTEAAITNVETSQDPAKSNPSSPETASPEEPVDNPPASTKSDSTAAAPTPAAPGSDPVEAATTSITIDETICGAGGQEAYFETKIQEIYICKNEVGDLTYIATPKKKGNSSFLPAQKIQQGDLVGYAAMEDTKTYIVTPGGFQLQEPGQPNQSEKVIRRQLAKD